MFNDERINLEIGKLKRLIIIISLIFTIMFLLVKILDGIYYEPSFIFYLTEIVTIVSCLIVLIISFFKKSKIKDEQYLQSKSEYYNKSFKILLYICFGTFALCMPGLAGGGYNILSSNKTINFLMSAVLFIGYGYIRYKNIYFNYNIIENDKNTYYKEVLKNIIKMIKFFAIIYGIGIISSFIYFGKYNLLILIGAIVIGFIYTSLSNGIFYLIISALERLFYKEENKKIITTPTLILLISGIIVYIIKIILGVITTIKLSSVISTDFIAKITTWNDYLTDLTILIVILAIIFLISDLSKNNASLKKKLAIPIFILVMFLLFEKFYQNAKIMGSIIRLVHAGMELPFNLTYSNLMMFINNFYNLSDYLFNIIFVIYILIILRKDIYSKWLFGLTTTLIVLKIAQFFSLFSTKTTMLVAVNVLYALIVIMLGLVFVIKYFKKNNIIVENEENLYIE